jgi:alkanesulfonate monooxygenase SsuD/methylene tetrahydromethanopterin reductase-like flavin-dependent oxidoreductase (luciferase family)
MLEADFSFGITVSGDPDRRPAEAAQHAEGLGFDAVSLHRDVLHGPPPSLEMWTLLTWIGASTSRVRLVPIVLAVPNRHPAVLAKMAASLDRLTGGGRLVLGLGGGAPMNTAAFRAFGLETRTSRATVEATEEAVDILHGLWGEQGFSYRGRHFSTVAAEIEPMPSQRIPIWVGGFGSQMLDLIGRKADGWLPSLFFMTPDKAVDGLNKVRQAAVQAGRDPDAITAGFILPVAVTDAAETQDARIVGSAAFVARAAAQIARAGFTFLNFLPLDDTREQRERIARDVVPHIRDLVQDATLKPR